MIQHVLNKIESHGHIFEERLAIFYYFAGVNSPSLNTPRFHYHHNSRSQVKVSQLITFLQLRFISNDNPHYVESTHHNHSNFSLRVLSIENNSTIFLINGLALGNSSFTNAVTLSLNWYFFNYFHVYWRVKAMIVTRSQVNYQLVQLAPGSWLQSVQKLVYK